MKQKTVREIVDYVVSYYATHPRAIVNGTCAYLIEGRRCAHSICIRDSKLKAVAERHNTNGASTLIIAFGDAVHKEEFRGHSPRFWNMLQSFHDTNYNWEETGEGNALTGAGEIFRGNIIREFGEPEERYEALPSHDLSPFPEAVISN